MEALELAIGIIGGNVVLLLSVAFLGKGLITHLLQKDIDKYKFELRAKSDIAIEQLKNDLKILSLEHEVKFTSLHEKRASAIEEIYSLLLETEYSMNGYINSLEEKGVAVTSADPELMKACQHIMDSTRLINKNNIYLPELVSKSLDAYVKELGAPALYHLVLSQDKNVDAKFIAALVAYWKISVDSLKKAKDSIRDEMRELLGEKNAIE